MTTVHLSTPLQLLTAVSALTETSTFITLRGRFLFAVPARINHLTEFWGHNAWFQRASEPGTGWSAGGVRADIGDGRSC